MSYWLFILAGIFVGELIVRFIHSIIYNKRNASSPIIDTLIIVFNILRNAGLRVITLLLASGYVILYMFYIMIRYKYNLKDRTIWILVGVSAFLRLVYLLVSDIRYRQ